MGSPISSTDDTAMEEKRPLKEQPSEIGKKIFKGAFSSLMSSSKSSTALNQSTTTFDDLDVIEVENQELSEEDHLTRTDFKDDGISKGSTAEASRGNSLGKDQHQLSRTMSEMSLPSSRSLGRNGAGNDVIDVSTCVQLHHGAEDPTATHPSLNKRGSNASESLSRISQNNSSISSSRMSQSDLFKFTAV